jgi:hypothetical protein
MRFYHMSARVDMEMRCRAPSLHFSYTILTVEYNFRSLAELDSRTFDMTLRHPFPDRRQELAYRLLFDLCTAIRVGRETLDSKLG